MFLLGFAGALRRSEPVGLDLAHVTWTDDGLKLLIERSKTDMRGDGAEIAISRGDSEGTCPVAALQAWLEVAEINAGPLFRTVNHGGVVETARLSANAVRQILLKRAAEPTPTAALELHDVALEIGLATNHSTYDTLYLAFAIAMGAWAVVVADASFVKDMQRHPDPVLAAMLLPLDAWAQQHGLA